MSGIEMDLSLPNQEEGETIWNLVEESTSLVLVTKPITDQLAEIETKIKTLKVQSQEDLDYAINSATLIDKLQKQAEKMRTERTEPLNEQLKEINGHFKPLQDKMKSWVRQLKDSVLAYRAEIERKAREERERLERERKAREEEEERKRAAAAQETKAGLAEQGYDFSDLVGLISPEPAEPPPPPPPAAPKPVMRTGIGSVAPVKTWTWEVVDKTKIPIDYLTWDTNAINTAVRSGAREIPGLRIFEKEDVRLGK